MFWPAVPQSDILVGLMVSVVPKGSRPVHFYSILPALLPVGFLHLDGAGGSAYVPGHRQGLQQLHVQIHAEVFSCRLG